MDDFRCMASLNRLRCDGRVRGGASGLRAARVDGRRRFNVGRTELAGFVNVAGDGGVHAFVLDPVVRADLRSSGIGAGLVAAAGRPWSDFRLPRR